MTDHKGSNALLVTSLAGLLGFGVGVLFAPRQGRDTRRRLQETSDTLAQHTKQYIHVAKRAVKDGFRSDQAAELRPSKREFARPAGLHSPIETKWDEELRTW